MGDVALQERLLNHAKAFDGLLSLIPAKIYYGEDNSDQWQRKRQTKEQAKAAKKGNLDPDSELNRNAKEVMDERARNKRKLEEMQEEDDISDEGEDEPLPHGVEQEKPGEGLRKKLTDEASAKKPRLSEEVDEAPTAENLPKKLSAKEERRLAKKQRKEEKKALKAEKQAEKPRADQRAHETPQVENHEHVQPSTEADEEPEAKETEMAPIDVSGLVTKEDEEGATDDSSPTSARHSPVFDSQPDDKNASVEPASTTTSISSAVPPSDKPKKLDIPKDTTILRARLAAKIEALRAARKADGPDGKPIRTRQELIEARRIKQNQRKAHKKEARRIAKELEDQKREEALASARNSPGSILGSLVSLDDERNANHFAFGRVAFDDGTQMSHDLSYEKKTEKKKGPSDPKTALLKLEAQKKRIASLDEDKRKEVLEKETWLAARRRAEGEKVRDDETLLKKAVKRKEKAKKKSEREWKERAQGVEKSIKERQRKREENLRKRKEEKHGGKGKKKSGSSKKNRPGFEGGGFGGRRK